jgi:dihydroflavonol-4-reductase
LRIFLTGATGYIGRALALRLHAAGHEVRALARSTSVIQPLRDAGIPTFSGDIRDRVSMREGMSGSDWVIHAAAELNLNAPDERIAGVNVVGSENVASLALKLGVPRFLSFSSVAKFGGSPDDGSPATEETPANLPYPTRYSATKAAGEERIRQYARQGLKVNTVYPSLVYGPPGKKEGANAILRSLLLGRFPALVEPDRLASWVHLDDLVDGVVAVMERAEPGRDYLFAGEAWTIRRLAGQGAALGGARPPRVVLSAPAAKRLFRLAAPLLAFTGRRLPVPLEQLDSLRRHWHFDDGRARRELGWKSRPLEVGLAQTLDYLKRQERPAVAG